MSKVEQTCRTPTCTETFVQDLAYTFNYIDSPLLGCNYGFSDVLATSDSTIREAQSDTIDVCKELVGFGKNFQGVSCVSDSDCAYIPPFHCDRLNRVCAVESLQQVEDAYLACFIARMDSIVESILRDVIPPLANYSTTDFEFYYLMRLAFNYPECASPRFAFENRYRVGFVYDAPSMECKARELGLTLPEDTAQVLEECGPQRCLDTSCKYESKDCYENCYPRVTLDATAPFSCPVGETFCNVDLSEEECDGRSVCAYCPPSGFRRQCFVLEGIDGPEDCESATVCELPDGQILTGLSEQECLQTQGYCDVDCDGVVCMSLKGLTGACVAEMVMSEVECDGVGGDVGEPTLWYTGYSTGQGLCVFPNVFSEADCDTVCSHRQRQIAENSYAALDTAVTTIGRIGRIAVLR